MYMLIQQQQESGTIIRVGYESREQNETLESFFCKFLVIRLPWFGLKCNAGKLRRVLV